MWRYWCGVLNFTIHFTLKRKFCSRLRGCNFLQCQSSEIGPHRIVTILDFLLFWNCKLQNRPKNLGLSPQLSTYLFGIQSYYIHTSYCSWFWSQNAQFQNNKKTMLTLELKLKSTQHLETLGHENVSEVPWDFSAQYLHWYWSLTLAFFLVRVLWADEVMPQFVIYDQNLFMNLHEKYISMIYALQT